MKIYKILLALALLSLLVITTQRAIAEPVEIEVRSSNIKVYAFEKVLNRWDEKEWAYFSDLIERESHWNSEAKNPKSSAYGLCQTMMSVHRTPEGFRKDPYAQVDWCIDYVSKRYETPKQAIKFWDSHKWF